MHEQIIYFGAPGTGKSHYVKEKLLSVRSERIFRVTIHPEYSYSDFIGQILPVNGNLNGSIDFIFQPGPFTRALVEAYDDTSKNVYLILEEMSRGNIAAIFGDIFQLLDRDNHFKSKYSIRNKNIADLIPHLNTDEIILPSNFNIIGTVNVNDQNVFPMDTAFKRRFDWEYITSLPIKKSSGVIDSKLNNAKIIVNIDNNSSNSIETNWQSFYTSLNSFITDKELGMGKNEDKQLGQFFIEFNNDLVEDSYSPDSSISNVANSKINKIIQNKLLLYLWQDVQGNQTFNNSRRIFDKDIRSFDDLYSKFGREKVYSDDFIEKFLKPSINRYPY